MDKSDKIPAIYISYAWNSESESIAEAIENEFQQRGVRIIRDKIDLRYKGRIKDFMEQIGQGKYVILIISNKYLRSENCMFELLQIFKNQDFYERIFPVVLDEVKIARATDRLELVKYWENEANSLDSKIRELKELSNLQGVTEDLNLYTEIRGNIANLTNILKDINTLNTDRHISSDFEQLFSLLKKRMKTDLDGKTGSLTIKKLVRPAVLIIGIVFVLLAFNVLSGGGIFKANKGSDQDMDEAIVDSSMNPANTDSISIKEAIRPEETPVADAAGITYDVALVVPSNMTNGDVYVDGQPAEIIDRTLIFINIRLRKKSGSHHIEIKNGDENCATDKLISQDNVQITLCN